jgi:RNase P subunit RPR2
VVGPNRWKARWSSGNDYIKTVYSDDEPDMLTMCPHCREVGPMPVHYMVTDADHTLQELMLTCIHCGAVRRVEPRIETMPDGTVRHWVDRTVIEEYEPPTHALSATLEDKDGNRVEVTVASSGGKVLWATCDDCGLPFRTSGHFAFTVPKDSPVTPDFRIAGCEHCGGLGTPIMTKVQDGDLVTYGGLVVLR